MIFPRPLLAVLLAAPLALFAEKPAPEPETLTEKSLREIVERDHALFAKAEKEGDNLDEALFQGEAQAIVSSYDIFIQKNSDFAPGFVAYGIFLDKVGMEKQAVAMLLTANKLDGNIPVVKNQLAKLLANDGKPLEALPWLMSAVQLAPNEPLYHFHLGKLLLEARDDFLKSGDFTKDGLNKAMLEAFRKAAELRPGEFSLGYQYAKAYYELDPPRWEEALGVWDGLREKATNSTTRQLVDLQRANVLLKLDRREEARALLDKVTDLQLAGEKQTLLDQLAPKAEK